MDMIEEGLTANSANELILGIIQFFLMLFFLGTICRCIMIGLKSMEEGKELGEVLRLIKSKVTAGICAAGAAGFLEIVERAFR